MHTIDEFQTKKDVKPDLSEQYITFLKLLADNWNSYEGAKMLTADLINYIFPRFHRCSTPIKVRILISFVYISPELLKDCSCVLSKLLRRCETDRDDWIRKLSRLLRSYVRTGRFNLRDVDTETAYRSIKLLDEYRHLHQCDYKLKPFTENPAVFNILKDSPLLALNKNNSNLSFSNGAIESLWNKLYKDNEKYFVNSTNETVNFTLGCDMYKFTQDIEFIGLNNLLNELHNVEKMEDQSR
jgi:hypothetical protein